MLYDEAVASVLWMPRSCAKLRGEEEGEDVKHVDVKSRSDSKRINEYCFDPHPKKMNLMF